MNIKQTTSIETITSNIKDNDFDIRMLDSESINSAQKERGRAPFFRYALLGIFFGIILVKAEIISWYRMQEMFGSAVVVGMISIWAIKRFQIKTIQGEAVAFYPKKFNWGQVYGGLLFGLGWGMTGACPGPLFAQIGTGALVVVVVLLSAIAGTWIYGYVREKLPH
jgi:uncharacterized membrane protein YedE/YeeE